MNYKHGAGIPALNANKITGLKIPLPPLPVQEEIVRILDSFTELTAELNDKLSAELTARQAQYEYYRDQLLTFGDEVEYVRLEEIIDYEQPTKYIVNKTDYDNSYSIPVLTAGKSFILGFTNEIDGIYPGSIDEPVIIFDDFTTSFHWVDFNFKVKSSAMKMLKHKNQYRSIFRYVYYAMKTIIYQPDFSQHERQWISRYSKFYIPIPSLAEQERIVAILDQFDALVNDLSSGLPAEIAARQKQYEYYRDQLLSFPEKPVAREALSALRVEKGVNPHEHV